MLRMKRPTIERLRAGVVAGAVLLLLTLGGVLLLAHHRARGLLRDLPARLGADIQKQTSGVTYSQTIQGRTVFTVHAAKATQLKDGKAELEDAGVVLYGNGNGRADRIYGKSFHYDQAAGVIRAMGVVQLDLEARAPVTAEERLRFASGAALPAEPRLAKRPNAQQPVHVTTSDLIYAQHTGMASTAAPVHFAVESVVGDARGASYDARNGYTIFQSDIRVSGTENGRAFVLTAQHGELDRERNQLVLRSALLTGTSADASGQQLRAAVLVLHLGAAGGVERAEGTDGVELVDAGGSAQAPLAELLFRAGNHPERVRLRGGVQFRHEDGKTPGETVSGKAAEGEGQFDSNGRLLTLRLLRDVAVVEPAAPDGASDRRLTARDEVLLDLAQAAGGGRQWVRQITANGAAEMRVTRAGASGNFETLAADRLEAWLHLDQSGRAQLETVTGRGHAVLHQLAAAAEETSRSETIDASFAGEPAGDVARGGPQLTTAVARGGVTLDRITKLASGATESMHGSARELGYDRALDQVNLQGEAMVAQAGSTVRAERMLLRQGTGDAEAYGGVQLTMTPANRAGAASVRAAAVAQSSPPAEPVHAVAAHALFQKKEATVTLTGDGQQVARLWRGASQVEAPLLVLRQGDGTLDAWGRPGAEAMPVRTILAAESGKAGPRSGENRADAAQVVRVLSERLHYSDRDRQAEFTGGVVLRGEDGMLRARRAVATMAAAGEKKGALPVGTAGDSRAAGSDLFGGALQRVVADGGITLEQPGRVARGEQVVYTTADGMFVLTGTPAAPPVVVDAATGSVTGAVLRFHAGDNSVAVEGGASPGTPGRVHTELRTKQ